jgi:hypothetical protein
LGFRRDILILTSQVTFETHPPDPQANNRHSQEEKHQKEQGQHYQEEEDGAAAKLEATLYQKEQYYPDADCQPPIPRFTHNIPVFGHDFSTKTSGLKDTRRKLK